MAQSTCPVCGFQTEKLLVACPRCRTALQHNHCKSCGRCPASSTCSAADLRQK